MTEPGKGHLEVVHATMIPREARHPSSFIVGPWCSNCYHLGLAARQLELVLNVSWGTVEAPLRTPAPAEECDNSREAPRMQRVFRGFKILLNEILLKNVAVGKVLDYHAFPDVPEEPHRFETGRQHSLVTTNGDPSGIHFYQALRNHKAKDSSGHYISWPEYNCTLHPEPLYLMGLRRAPISTVPLDIGWPRYLEIQRADPNALCSLFRLLSF
jgi:hypothetical protein